jgi:hypothetical protein
MSSMAGRLAHIGMAANLSHMHATGFRIGAGYPLCLYMYVYKVPNKYYGIYFANEYLRVHNIYGAPSICRSTLENKD